MIVTGVFEGGGVRAIALAGAAAAVLDQGHRFEAAVGTSGGAWVAAAVAAGAGSTDLRREVANLAWSALLDGHVSNRWLRTVKSHWSVLRRQGVHRGITLERSVAGMLRRLGVATFGDLPLGALRVVTTDIRHGRGVILPDELPTYGYEPATFPVTRAVLMSAAVPFLFSPIRLSRSGATTGMFVDGALAARFPSQLAQTRRHTIGFRVANAERHRHHEVSGPLSLASAVISAGMTARESLPSSCPSLDEMITVTVKRDPLDFDLTASEAADLFETGYHQARQQTSEELGVVTSSQSTTYERSVPLWLTTSN